MKARTRCCQAETWMRVEFGKWASPFQMFSLVSLSDGYLGWLVGWGLEGAAKLVNDMSSVVLRLGRPDREQGVMYTVNARVQFLSTGVCACTRHRHKQQLPPIFRDVSSPAHHPHPSSRTHFKALSLIRPICHQWTRTQRGSAAY